MEVEGAATTETGTEERDFLEETRDFWEPRLGYRPTREQARRIVEQWVGLVRSLEPRLESAP